MREIASDLRFALRDQGTLGLPRALVLAGPVPARRAMRVDPMHALRYE
jgi:hypothetical protein